ncbi:MAG TPA: efflux RND transporter periplasmic adaptor subunit [Polyangiaceae bacterium]|nr:efflux RND transporter periplasmic adaptor subunit [Polyangiaceae bacterium]
MNRAVSDLPTENSPPPAAARGRVGLWTLGVGAALVAAWLGVRVVSTLTQQKAIEGARKAAPAPTDTQTVQVVSPVRTTWIPSVRLEGTIEAEQRSNLGFKVGGKLGPVQVRLGDQVKAGQLLARLDAVEAAAQQSAAKAQVDAAQAQLMLAQDAERRTSQLVKSGALAEANGIQAEQQRALAEAQASSARAQLGLAGATVQNHTLVAPFAGVVTRAPTTRGAVVAPGEPLFEVVDMSKLRLRGSIGEAEASLVRVGSQVTIQTDAGPAVGQVRAIVSVLDAATRRVPVEADLTPQPGLRVGSFVRATIANDQAVEVWSLPGQALRPGSQDVILVEKGGVLEERVVRFSVEPSSGNLLVQNGLVGDEHVVVAPQPEARSGDRVVVGTRPAQTPVAENDARGSAAAQPATTQPAATKQAEKAQ